MTLSLRSPGALRAPLTLARGRLRPAPRPSGAKRVGGPLRSGNEGEEGSTAGELAARLPSVRKLACPRSGTLCRIPCPFCERSLVAFTEDAGEGFTAWHAEPVCDPFLRVHYVGGFTPEERAAAQRVDRRLGQLLELQ